MAGSRGDRCVYMLDVTAQNSEKGSAATMNCASAPDRGCKALDDGAYLRFPGARL